MTPGSPGAKRWLAVALRTIALLAVATSLLWGTAQAQAHGFNSVVYAQLSAPAEHELEADLSLEYDLLVYSVDKNQYTTHADAWNDDFYDQAYEQAWQNPDDLPEAESDAAMAKAITEFSTPVQAYLADRFTVTVGDLSCTATMDPAVAVSRRDPGSGEVPFADITLRYTCPDAEEAPVVTSTLFPDSEGFVTDTKTLVAYDVAGFEGDDGAHAASGELILDQSTTSGSTGQRDTQQFWEFFQTGFNHVLQGLDHILFLVILVVSSRRPREVILAATAFTLAHAVTVSMVVLGVFTPASDFVEPTIAFSILAVAAWYLFGLWRRKGQPSGLELSPGGHFSLDRDGWIRVGIVFAFGLVHGMGFAGALNLDGRSGWDQLLSLVSFNVGIEAVQLCVIVAIFPLLALLRRRSHLGSLWMTGGIAAGVATMGMLWFVGRVSGWYEIPSDIG